MFRDVELLGQGCVLLGLAAEVSVWRPGARRRVSEDSGPPPLWSRLCAAVGRFLTSQVAKVGEATVRRYSHAWGVSAAHDRTGGAAQSPAAESSLARAMVPRVVEERLGESEKTAAASDKASGSTKFRVPPPQEENGRPSVPSGGWPWPVPWSLQDSGTKNVTPSRTIPEEG